MRLWNRNVRVTAYRVRPGSYFDLEPNGIEITGLRIQFEVQRRLSGQPDTCTIVITNASEQTRGMLTQHPLSVILEAGYDGEYRRLFAGDLRWGSSVYRQTDWETTLQVSDGARAFKEAKVGRSFEAGVTVRQAVTECARVMGLIVPREFDVSRELSDQFAAGLTLDGDASDELTRLLAPYGYSWTIQDGQLRAYQDQQVQSGQAFLISEDTGMIDAPEFAPPTRSAKKSKSITRSTVQNPRLTVRTLLYPQIMPGSKLQIESLTTRGIYKALQVSHVGDTYGDDYTTTIDAKAVN